MIEQHPADTAKPGDAFRDENGATWLLTDDVDTYSWITSGVDKTQWRTTVDARERTLTPLVDASATPCLAECSKANYERGWDAAIAEKATADGEALGRLVRDVRDAEEPGHTCTIDGVLIAKVDTYGQTAAYRAALTRIADALRVAHGDRIDVDGLVRVAEAAAGALADQEAALDAKAVGLPAPDAIRDLRQRVDAEVIDASDPAQLRRAADVVVASSVGIPGQRNVLADALRAEADRLDVDAADRAKAEQIAEDVWNSEQPTVSTIIDVVKKAVLADIRAGRDAERGA